MKPGQGKCLRTFKAVPCETLYRLRKTIKPAVVLHLLRPVSYTHLDVYKRPVLKRLGVTVVYPEADIAVRIGQRLISGNLLAYIALEDGVEAVSYTHLDVYKSQPLPSGI